MQPTIDLSEMENQDPSNENSGNDHQISTIDPHNNIQSLTSPTNLFPVTSTPPFHDNNHSNNPNRLSSSSSRSTVIRNYPPSPSRIRLDSEYSSRLQQHQSLLPQSLPTTILSHHPPPSHQSSQSNLSVISPPGIRRGRHRNFPFFSPSSGHTSGGGVSAAGGGSFESSDESKASNTRSAFFNTPERSSSSSEERVGTGIGGTNNRDAGSSSKGGDPPTRVGVVSGGKRRATTRGGGGGQTRYSFSPNHTTESSSPWSTTMSPSRNPKNPSSSLAASVSIDTSDTGYSDRFIPSRATSNLSFQFSQDSTDRGVTGVGGVGGTNGPNPVHVPNLDPDEINAMTTTTPITTNEPTATTIDGTPTTNTIRGGSGSASEGSHSQSLLNALLRSELLGSSSSPDVRPLMASSTTPASTTSPTMGGRSSSEPNQNSNHGNNTPNLAFRENLFRFQSPRHAHTSQLEHNLRRDSSSSIVNSFHLSPVGSASSHRLLAAPQKRKRKIAKVPFKVLDAPSLQDDFYLNLVDWSSQNVLAVGLGSCVYLWSACTSKVTKLCDLSTSDDIVTSVSWTQRGTHLAIGTNHGDVQIWDAVKCSLVRTMSGHSARIGTLSWNGPTLASGSRDRLICLRDVRNSENYVTGLSAHKQEVCGLKWSPEEPAQLASGGNDNKLLVWDVKNSSQPVHRFAEHTAAVKAIAWSPHQHGLLASGGGTADRCIRFWNTVNGSGLSCIDTGSQVCNLAWSQNCNEIVSTHGYSLNQIVVWRYPSMTKVATLTGHTYRVLYLAVSPDGSTIVTGAGDETLRFWQVFPGPRSQDKGAGSGLLFPASPGSIIR